MTFGQQILNFYDGLELPLDLPDQVSGMQPWKTNEARSLMSAFYKKYYNDHNPRTLLMGINPGRLGSGITGIPFTDPLVLEQYCGLENQFSKKRELSSAFVFMLVEALGGPEVFYGNFYISAISPIGFLKVGKNMNYYDSTELFATLETFMVECLQAQAQFPLNTQMAFSVGKGKNFTYFKRLNDRLKIFENLGELPHPRWLMQYRRKHLRQHLSDCVQQLTPFIQNGR